MNERMKMIAQVAVALSRLSAQERAQVLVLADELGNGVSKPKPAPMSGDGVPAPARAARKGKRKRRGLAELILDANWVWDQLKQKRKNPSLELPAGIPAEVMAKAEERLARGDDWMARFGKGRSTSASGPEEAPSEAGAAAATPKKKAGKKATARKK